MKFLISLLVRLGGINNHEALPVEFLELARTSRMVFMIIYCLLVSNPLGSCW
jgi:hypothetical protein